MSTIRATNNVGIYKIQKFLGLNENPNGDQLLKLGEASECKNWKVTRDFNLKRRPGTHTMFTLSLHEPVRGMWYGNINGVPTGLAACDGHLWKFYEDEEYLSVPVDLGEFDTSRRVNFFAYSDIVYILNGDEYMQYDGVSFKAVTGYIPIVAVSRTPNGSASTLLEEVNKLNNMRKVWFSPDGEDNVFLLPEKDILSVHYVKNLGTGEYINPSEYNVDRINGKVTFGKDVTVEYVEGQTSYVITDEDIEDVGSIEINGEVPTVTYLPDRSGVVFDTAPEYGQTLTLTSGEEFTEEFTGDGETTGFELANKDMNTFVVNVNGEEKHSEKLYENVFLSGQPESYIKLLRTPEINDKIVISTNEHGEITTTKTLNANNYYVQLDQVSGFSPQYCTVSYFTGGTELPEHENFEVLACPYPESIEVDEDTFCRNACKKQNQISYDVENLAGIKNVYLYRSEEEADTTPVDKWLYSYEPLGVNSERNIMYSSKDAHGNTNEILNGFSVAKCDFNGNISYKVFCVSLTCYYSGGNSQTIMLFPGKDFHYTRTFIDGVVPITTYTITLVDAVFDTIVVKYGITSPLAIGNIYGHMILQDGFKEVTLDEFGITYEPKYGINPGDLIEATFVQNFYYPSYSEYIYIRPHGTTVTANTKFNITRHATDRSKTTTVFYAAENNPDPDGNYQLLNVYYSNYFDSTQIQGLTAVTQDSLAVTINGKPYYENGDYVISNGVLTFAASPEENDVIQVFETHEPIEKTYTGDGETVEFSIGYVGAESIAVEVDDESTELDRRFTYDADTKTVTILDTENMEDGDVITIKGAKPPARGINMIEICYSAGMAFTQTVNKMTNAEIFLGTQDNAVFLYGDGSNKAFYSGIDYNGKPRADYFPDLNEMTVADSNTPITGMIRHFSQLICFKSKSVYTIHYGQITTATGNNEYAFYITPVNKEIGNAALGQVRLVLNSPFALYANDLYEWKSNSRYSSNLSQDERSAHRISDRIYATLATFNAEDCYCYDDNPGQEYYIWYQDKALVFNYAANAWYMYQGLNVSAMCNLEGDLLVGTADGKIKIMSEDYTNDDGDAFDSYWESGSMDFGSDYMRKLMSEVWISVKPDKNYSVNLTASTDRKVDFTEKTLSGEESDKDTPMVKKLKMKAKKFAYLKLILQTNDPDNGATILSLDPKVRETGYAK